MKRLAIFILLCLSLTACGQTNVDRNPLPYTLPIGTSTRTQISLPALRPLLGHGRQVSILKAHSSVTTRFITNAAYGSGGDTYHTIARLTIDGDRYADTLTGVGQNPVADGVEIDGKRTCIQDCLILEFWGAGVSMVQGQFCVNNVIGSCFSGIRVASSDVWIIGNEVAGCRDYGLEVTSGSNIMSIGNHYYGHVHAAHLAGNGNFHATEDIYADSQYGGWCATPGSRFTACLAQQNYTAAWIIGAAGCSIVGGKAYVGLPIQEGTVANENYGVWFNASGTDAEVSALEVELSDFKHGSHTATGTAPTAYKIDGSHIRIAGRIYDNCSTNGCIGMEIGAVAGIVIDVSVGGNGTGGGFHSSNDKIMTIASGARGIRGVIYVEGFGQGGRTINDYFDINSNWTGSIDVYDATNGDLEDTLDGGTGY